VMLTRSSMQPAHLCLDRLLLASTAEQMWIVPIRFDFIGIRLSMLHEENVGSQGPFHCC
jgi:hypothetical protein